MTLRTDRGGIMKTIDLIAGARPNFMKIAPIIDAIKKAQARGSSLRYRLIHTGQHYDKAMSGGFFEQLGIPEPDVNLEVGSGTQAEQTAAIMVRYEKVLLDQKSDLCLVVGDVTSTMAAEFSSKALQLARGGAAAAAVLLSFKFVLSTPPASTLATARFHLEI